MTKRMLIDALHPEETRVVIADENQIFDFDFVSTAKKQIKGNIYLAKITRVEPSLQAAFVEYGGGKQGFLPFAEIHTDYYQIPVSDRKKLMEEAAREAELADSIEQSDKQEESINSEIDSDGNEENVNPQDEPEFPLFSEIPAQTDAPETEETKEERPAYLMQSLESVASEEVVAPTVTEATDTTDTSANTNLDLFAGENLPETNAAEEEKEEIETISDEEEEARNKRRRNSFLRRYKIQEVIRRGQIVLVQVIKEERGNKGASLTTYLSLAGRYCVLMPNSPKDGGISRKIASAEDRKRLKAISTEFKLAEGMSVIIRTAGMDRTHAEIKRDFDYLVKLWNNIREDTLKSNAPALIYEESNIVKRAIRDQYSNDISEVLIEGESAYKSARDFMKILLPSHMPKIKQYSAQTPLFYAYDVEEQLLSMHDPVVKMKSGAYLVINPTEAMISIDVNSGRATGERNIEETALKTNLEAAAEIAKQLRLRDLAGLVVIDFIDMLDSRNRRAVERMLKDSMKNDRAKIQLGRISPFGLLEMSRQRMRPSISETNMIQCPHCVGRGVIRSHESMSIQVIRAIEKEASNGNVSALRVLAPQELAVYILNHKRSKIAELEKRHSVSIQILIDLELTSTEFNIEKTKRSGADRQDYEARRQRNKQERVETESTSESADNSVADESQGESTSGDRGEGGRRNRRRGRRGGRSNFPNRPDNVEAGSETESSETTDGNTEIAAEASTEASSEDGNQQNGRRERGYRDRGRRGRRNWRDRKERNGSDETPADDIPTSWSSSASEANDGKVLPAFASDLRPVASPAPPTYKPFHDYQPAKPVEVEAATVEKDEPASPPKRGWWQKMISLDD